LTLPVLIILAVLWAVVLVPPLLRSRGQRTADSIVDFNRKLDVLGQTNGNLELELDETDAPVPGSGVVQPGLSFPTPSPLAARPLRSAPVPRMTVGAYSTASQRSAKRRREVLQVLGLSIVCTLLLANGMHSGAAWALQIFVDVIAVAYLGLWAWTRSVEADRMNKVRYMPDLRVPEMRVPEMSLRRSASS
jgi:hypothetical protein